ncbi:MAG: hypothetical protein FWH19_04835 [Treponema sp.]|nr:hypothetical protein [Treponema sp.]
MDEDETITIIPKEELDRQKKEAIAHMLGGVILMLITSGVRFRLPGIVLSSMALFFGLRGLFSHEHKDKKPPIVMTSAGILGLLIQFGPPMFRPFAVFILGLGAIGLFALGLWKGIIFLLNQKGRK